MSSLIGWRSAVRCLGSLSGVALLSTYAGKEGVHLLKEDSEGAGVSCGLANAVAEVVAPPSLATFISRVSRDCGGDQDLPEGSNRACER